MVSIMELLLIESAGKINILVQCSICGQYIQYNVYKYPYNLELTEKIIIGCCLHENSEHHDENMKYTHVTALELEEV